MIDGAAAPFLLVVLVVFLGGAIWLIWRTNRQDAPFVGDDTLPERDVTERFRPDTNLQGTDHDDDSPTA